MSRNAEDSGVESEADLDWLLGFVDEPRYTADLMRHRFPSKVGGRPAWLDPVTLPSYDQLTCAATGKVMQFLIQVYAPVDDNPEAFHRTIYMFLSPDGSTLSSPGAVKALRCQLPRKNNFYPFDPPKKEEKTPPALSQEQLELSLTSDPWRSEEQTYSNAQNLKTIGSIYKNPPAMFNEFELVVEPEPEESPKEDAKVKNLIEQYTTRVKTEGEYTEEELPSDVIDTFEAAIPAAQQHFAAFAAVIAKEPEQVLRYCFEEGAEPLCPAPEGIPGSKDVPCCGRCGGPRRFEFQVMPQLLNHLGVDEADPKAPDWGTIAVYSCAASCSTFNDENKSGGSDGKVKSRSNYVEEYVWVQPST